MSHEHARHVSTWVRNHARHVGTWAHKHARQVDTWARKHARNVGIWVRKHLIHVGTWAVSKQDKLALEHVFSTQGTQFSRLQTDRSHHYIKNFHKRKNCNDNYELINIAQKMKIYVKDFFSKCDQILQKLWIWSHWLKKLLLENFIICAVKTDLFQS